MITPDHAQELLDGTVPGPWLCEKDGDEYEFVIGTEDFGIITEVNRESDGRLIAAAPALAEQIANMRYEYAVQVKGGWWVGENDAGDLVPTTDPMRALRHYHPDVALKLAEEAGKQLGHECCVARRLTTDWEVTE